MFPGILPYWSLYVLVWLLSVCVLTCFFFFGCSDFCSIFSEVSDRILNLSFSFLSFLLASFLPNCLYWFIYLRIYVVVLELGPRNSHLLGKCSNTELYSLSMFLPQLSPAPGSWDDRCLLSHLALVHQFLISSTISLLLCFISLLLCYPYCICFMGFR